MTHEDILLLARQAGFSPDAAKSNKLDRQRAGWRMDVYTRPAQALPARLVLFTLRDLKAERKRLDGFLALGNEVGRAAEYDEWIAALETYAAAHGITPKENGHE